MKPAYPFFLLIFLLLFALIVLPPYLEGMGCAGCGDFSRALYSRFCHQRADRSLFLFGYQMPVCARCFGIYSGLLAGCLLYPLIWRRDDTPPAWVVLAALTPLLLDGGSQFLGLRESDNILRFATGFLFGAVIPYYLVPVFQGALSTFIRHRR